jgi:peptidoglycan/LPS O-acetylase OafA/YrhL
VAAICSWRIVVKLGEAAYAIYMLHFPFLAYSVGVFVGGAKEGKAPPEPWTYLCVFLIGVSLISLAVHRWWEIPWRRKIRRIMLYFWPDRTPPIVVASP